MQIGRVVARVAVAVRAGDELLVGVGKAAALGGYPDYHGAATGTLAVAGEPS